MSPSPRPRTPGRVVELFAGVGGFRIGLERELVEFDAETGWRWRELPEDARDWSVVWGNQWEPSTKSQPAFDCYRTQFEGQGQHVNEDIAEVLNRTGVPLYDGRTRLDVDDLTEWEHAPPTEFELLVGGFPCQDYSVAKPLSQAAGMGGEKGALWWEIARMLQQYRPPHVLLENVDRLLKSPSRQRGRDFAVMLACFAQLGYSVEWRVVNAADYGFPQRRKRVFIYARHEGLEVGPPSDDTDPDRWASVLRVRDRIVDHGVMASALPCRLEDGAPLSFVSLGNSFEDIDPYDISRGWGSHAASPWGNAGVMVGGVAWTADVEAVYEGDEVVLGDVLLPLDRVVREHASFLIPLSQLDFDDEPDRSTWNYLKGSKKEERTKTANGETFTYHYSEGAVAFPEPLDRASRTILTGEGGRSPSRFKLVVRQVVPAELVDGDVHPALRDAMFDDDETGETVVFRRITPVELERLDMFPDDWTAETAPGRPMADGRRAFCTGNALVIGLVDRIGEVIANSTRPALRVVDDRTA